MKLRWPIEFDDWIKRTQAKSAEGSAYHRRQLELLVAALEMLRALTEPPTQESAALKLVAQSRRHQLWRTSHPYEEGIAFRLICWFPPGSDEVVVALFSGEKSRIGDVWYDSVAQRADPLINLWLQRQAQEQERPDD